MLISLKAGKLAINDCACIKNMTINLTNELGLHLLVRAVCKGTEQGKEVVFFQVNQVNHSKNHRPAVGSSCHDKDQHRMRI